MEIARTRVYERRIETLLSAEERDKAENEIVADPTAWPVIQGTGGVRKARFSRDDLGKRVAAASATFFGRLSYAHNEKDKFSKAECNAMKTLVKSLLKAKRDEKRKAK